MKLLLARIESGEVVPTMGRRTLAFAGRTELLRLWDQMGAGEQERLLLAAEAILAREAEPVVVPAISRASIR